jgi:tetratricopeptide (TPR) repeat protein
LASNLITTTILLVALFFVPPPTRFLLGAALSLLFAAYFYKSQEPLFRQHRVAGGLQASLVWPGVLSVTALVLFALAYVSISEARYRTKFAEGVRFLKAGDLAKAEREFEEAQRIDPDKMEGSWNLALIYEKSGDLEKAKRELHDFIARHPNSPPKMQGLLDRLEAGKS